jgi:hypothetical protein
MFFDYEDVEDEQGDSGSMVIPPVNSFKEGQSGKGKPYLKLID